MAADLSTIVKAYDVRGVVPDQWDESLAELFGAAFVRVTAADAIVVGHDMRPSSPGLSRAFARGAAAQGVDVTEIGLCSTDQLYYASGALNLPGAMFTASHNPAQYNGIKMCRAGAAPVGQDTGLTQIRELAEQYKQAQIDYLDGITIDFGDWWFNVRKSNTEPMLRLNLEAKTPEMMQEKLKEVQRILGEAELDVALVVEELVDVLQRHLRNHHAPRGADGVGAVDARPERERLDELVVVG